MSKKLSESETEQLEGVLYVIEGKEKYCSDRYFHSISIYLGRNKQMKTRL